MCHVSPPAVCKFICSISNLRLILRDIFSIVFLFLSLRTDCNNQTLSCLIVLHIHKDFSCEVFLLLSALWIINRLIYPFIHVQVYNYRSRPRDTPIRWFVVRQALIGFDQGLFSSPFLKCIKNYLYFPPMTALTSSRYLDAQESAARFSFICYKPLENKMELNPWIGINQDKPDGFIQSCCKKNLIK